MAKRNLTIALIGNPMTESSAALVLAYRGEQRVAPDHRHRAQERPADTTPVNYVEDEESGILTILTTNIAPGGVICVAKHR